MAGSPVGESVRDLLHALDPQPTRDAARHAQDAQRAQHGADTQKQETEARPGQDMTQRAGTRADEVSQREQHRAAHWKQAMMQHKKSWRPEQWWNAARKRAHEHEEQRGTKAERRRVEVASWRGAASAQVQESATQPETDVDRLRADDNRQPTVAGQVRSGSTKSSQHVESAARAVRCHGICLAQSGWCLTGLQLLPLSCRRHP